MPRLSVRNIVVTVNILLLTALVIHLKQVLWDRQLSPADLGTSHIPDELLDDAQFSKRRTTVVVAAQASENATWLDAYFPDWEKNIYRVDDKSAALSVPKNKGRESMVYLTFVFHFGVYMFLQLTVVIDISLITTIPSQTTSFSSIRTDTNGTTTTRTMMAYQCCAASSCPTSRKKDT